MNDFPNAMTRTLKDDGDDFLNTALKKWKFNTKFSRNIKLFSFLGKFFNKNHFKSIKNILNIDIFYRYE